MIKRIGKAILLTLIELMSTTGHCQHLSFKFGTRFHRTNLDVRWNVATNALPPRVLVYRLLPRSFPSTLVSNLMTLGGFTYRDTIRSNAEEMLLRSPDYSSFWVSSRLGAIEYHPPRHYGPTNLAEHVPTMSDMPGLTTNFLKEIGIPFDEIEKRPDGSLDLNYSEPFTVYVANHSFITNIEYRTVTFRRTVDGGRFVGNGAGGDGHVEFGVYGRPSQIRLSWRNLARYGAYPAVAPETLVKWIKEGKAVQGMIRLDVEPIDWKTVKSVTVTGAKLCYYGGSPFEPSDWLMPFVALWTTVDRGHGTVDVEIDSPIIEETKE